MEILKEILQSSKIELKNKNRVILKIKVIAKAEKTEWKGLMADNTIKLAVAQAAEKGKANQAICAFLAEEFGVDKTNVSILSGKSARMKLIQIAKEKQ